MGHTSQEDLAKLLREAKEKVQIGEKYYHYKQPDMTYILVDVCMLEATEEPAAVYKAEYGEEITWVRALNDFLSEVEVDGVKKTKFTLI